MMGSTLDRTKLHDLLALLRVGISGAARICGRYLDRLALLFDFTKPVGEADGKQLFRPKAFAPTDGLDGAWVRSQSRPAATMPCQFDRHATEEALGDSCMHRRVADLMAIAR
jgi:hypothetical protein